MFSDGFLVLTLGRLRFRLHLLLPVVAIAVWCMFPRFGARYLALLLVLLLHEMAHALASLALGGRLTKVNVLPHFAWAAVEDFGDRRTAVVAIAGPLASLLFGMALFLAGGRLDPLLLDARILDFLFTTTLVFGIGNMVPVPPLDGGRAAVALLRRA